MVIRVQLLGRLLVVLLTSMRSMWSAGGEDCSFPKVWHGRWLEGGTTSVIITATEFSNKGVCYDQHKDYFLVENRLEHCHRCLLITTRHPNVIEYQQSYCIGRQSLQSICAQILVSGDNFLTLVREAATPVPCPFQKPFHFVYNNNSLCYCRSPLSYLHHCSDASIMVFHFRKCRNCALTSDREASFQCLATWENGRELYAVGAFLQKDNFTVRQTYHCFMYHMYDSVMYIVMSSSVLCHGFFRYPKEGQLTMELTEDVYGWPPASCTFPAWFIAHAWTDLSDAGNFSFISGSDVMIRERRRHPQELNATMSGQPCNQMTRSIVKCLRVLETPLTSKTLETGVEVIVQVLENCQTSYQCIRLRHRPAEQAPHLILMETSESVGEGENCSAELFYRNQSHVLVRQGLEPGSCPFTGRYTSSVDSRGCQVELQSGCRNQSTMILRSSCLEHPILQLTCLKWWSVQQKLFLLAMQFKHSENPRFACYSFCPQNGTMRINYEEHCDFLSSSSGSTSATFEFFYRLDHCLSSPDDDGNLQPSKLRPSTVASSNPPPPPPPASRHPALPPPPPSPGKSPRLIHEPNPDPQLRDADASPQLNHRSASAAFSAAAATSLLRLNRILSLPLVCLWTRPLLRIIGR